MLHPNMIVSYRGTTAHVNSQIFPSPFEATKATKRTPPHMSSSNSYYFPETHNFKYHKHVSLGSKCPTYEIWTIHLNHPPLSVTFTHTHTHTIYLELNITVGYTYSQQFRVWKALETPHPLPCFTNLEMLAPDGRRLLDTRKLPDLLCQKRWSQNSRVCAPRRQAINTV